MLAQRAACEGMGGILSAGVELHEHQVAAARRVLLDPVRRYLLADEVGLGKTVEAGMVLRQLLIDDTGDALVLVPTPLVSQWRDELLSKFRVDQFPGRVRVAAHDELQDIRVGPRLIVVVDEAHRIAEAQSIGSYHRLCAVAHAANALLLLSATPVRSNEDAFLRLLHLLDPINYRLDDVDAFRQRVFMRDELSTTLSSLEDETPLAYLHEPAGTLRRLLPGDEVLRRLLDALEASIADGESARARTSAREIRTHISETYRIHRRLVRNRRTGSLIRSFPVRGRVKADPWLLHDPDSRRRRLLDEVEGLRTALASRSDLDGGAILRTVAGRASAPIHALGGLASALRGQHSDLTALELAGLLGYAETHEAQVFADALDDLLEVHTDKDRLDAVVAWARRHVGKRRVAVACSFPATAAEMAQRLEVSLGSHRVARLLDGQSDAERAAEVERFVVDQDRTVLVLDHVGEEGVNLQVVEEVLHLDLPTSTSRLEQRLGRFDRWANRRIQAHTPVRSVVFADIHPIVDEQLGAWRRGLDEGVELFDRSSATLQYVLPELEAQFFSVALDRGFSEAGELLAMERATLALQRRRIEGQDMLDALDDRTDDECYLEALLAVEDDARDAERAFRGYAADALGFTASSTDAGTRYGVSTKQPPHVTESEVMRLGPRNLAVSYVAERQRVRRGSGFLRWGEPLVDALADFAVRDDRGRAFAVEVPMPGIAPAGGPRFVFTFDILITAGTDALADLPDASSAHAATRRVLRFLAPTVERVWLALGQGEPPLNLVKRLESAEGTNLGSRLERFDELTSGIPWAQRCEDAATEALQIVAQRSTVQRRLGDAIRRASEARDHEHAVRQARAQAGANEQYDDAVLDAVDGAVADPRLTVDACGVLVLTALEPE